jgi:excisionase family DNA binding protein
MPTVLDKKAAMKEPPRYLSVRQSAARLGVSEKTVYRMIWNKEIEAHYIRGGWRISEEALDTYMTSHSNRHNGQDEGGGA